MIIGIIKYLLFMILFYFFIKIIGYILKFIVFFKKNNFNSSQDNDNLNNTLKMLQCENCKIYVSKSDAYIYNGKIFCKKEHVL